MILAYLSEHPYGLRACEMLIGDRQHERIGKRVEALAGHRIERHRQRVRRRTNDIEEVATV